MNRSLSLGIAVACVATSAMSAQASDLPGRSSPLSFYKAPSELPFNWTGFYAGMNGGYAWGQSSWSDPAVGANSGSFNTSGGLVGGQFGYNWQTGAVGETDALGAGSAALDAHPVSVSFDAEHDGGGQCQTQQSWVGTT